MYDELVKRLRYCAVSDNQCSECKYRFGSPDGSKICLDLLMVDAAEAIEELLKAAKAMHTWIFLNTGDEQAAYNECGLTDEMNTVLGYGGQYIVEPPKEETK